MHTIRHCELCRRATVHEAIEQTQLFGPPKTLWFCEHDHGRCSLCDCPLHGKGVEFEIRDGAKLCRRCSGYRWKAVGDPSVRRDHR